VGHLAPNLPRWALPWVDRGDMNGILTKVRQTRASRSAAAVRILLGLLFLSTGVMKFAVPELRAALAGQLTVAGIPFQSFNMWLVPAAEIAIGMLFILGFLSRLASLSAVVMMVFATYVHLVADDPALFPLQPEEPIIAGPYQLLLVTLWLQSAGPVNGRTPRPHRHHSSKSQNEPTEPDLPRGVSWPAPPRLQP